MTETLSTGLTAEWCREQADECDVDARWARHANQDAGAAYAENLAQALRIAAAVLDEDAVMRIAELINSEDEPGPLSEQNASQRRFCFNAARLVLSYLQGESK